MRWFWEEGYVSGIWFRDNTKHVPARHAIQAGIGSKIGR